MKPAWVFPINRLQMLLPSEVKDEDGRTSSSSLAHRQTAVHPTTARRSPATYRAYAWGMCIDQCKGKWLNSRYYQSGDDPYLKFQRLEFHTGVTR
jgi:hypothetical protein